MDDVVNAKTHRRNAEGQGQSATNSSWNAFGEKSPYQAANKNAAAINEWAYNHAATLLFSQSLMVSPQRGIVAASKSKRSSARTTLCVTMSSRLLGCA